MHDELAQAEDRFEAMRRAAPDPWAACVEALAGAGISQGDDSHDSWLGAGRGIAAALADTGHELPYHNRHHFAEATLAMGWLCGAARAAGSIGAADAAVGILAMLGHDIGHDGSPVADGRLEAKAAALIAGIVGTAGLDADTAGRISDVILATNPALVARNAGQTGTPAGLLRRLANEADVFASLLPRLGPSLGEALAAERHLPADRPRYRERLGFLTLYADFSAAACQLGLADCWRAQIAALAAAGTDAASGADLLDRMPAAAAGRRYARQLAAAGIVVPHAGRRQ